MRILTRADGSTLRGFGHISKQITLTKKLESLGHEVYFITQKEKAAGDVLSKNGIRYAFYEGEPCSNIDIYAESFKPDVIVLDILNTNTGYIHELNKHHAKLVTFDNTDSSAFLCDLIFNIMYCHDRELKKKYDSSSLYEGYKYIIMDECFKHVKEIAHIETQRVLLTQGGADTTNKTPLLMECLIFAGHAIGIDFDVDVVIGPAFNIDNIAKIEEIAAQKCMFHLHYRPNGLVCLISDCDMVVTAGGTTMWEVAACKRPMYVFINEVFEDETAQIIKSLGFALYDGNLPSRESVQNSLRQLTYNREQRSRMVDAMKRYDIASGLDRVVNKMYEHGVLV